MKPKNSSEQFCERELLRLDIFLKQILFNENKISVILYDYVFSNSKRVRSKLLFLVLNSLGIQINAKHIKIGAISEIVHNASLVHDDIIDESITRRNKASLNAQYGNKFAVIAGDYLLSIALNHIVSIKNEAITNNYLNCLNGMLEAEATQYFTQNELPTFEQYIEKSRLKTALLFESTIKNGLLISENKTPVEILARFATEFGVAFQIKNDIANIEGDLKNGIYTAPIIFLEKNIISLKNKSEAEIMTLLKNSDCIDRAKSLLNKHIKSAIDIISFIGDNQHKANLISFCSELYED